MDILVLDGDGIDPEIKEEQAYAKIHPNFLGTLESNEADWEYNRGRFRRGIELDRDQERQSPKDQRDLTALSDDAYRAGLYGEVGDLSAAQRELASAIALQKMSISADLSFRIALALARSGEPQLAHKYLDNAVQDLPQKSTQRLYDENVVRAVVQLGRGDAPGAIQTLEPLRPYDDAYFREEFCGLFPAYYRGLAYLKLGNGRAAAAEFQKLAGHKVLVSRGLTILNSLWHLQLARAQVLEGDKDSSSDSYQQFLALWKNADPDIPIYREAKAEYAELIKGLNRTN